MKKFQELESARGIASLIVLIHHFFLGFSPYTTGLLPQTRSADSFYGSYFFWVFNGTAAVNFFFLLSGFVLTFKYFESGNNDLGAAVVKRLPRLALLCVITMTASSICLIFGWHAYKIAASFSASPWLADFAYAGIGNDFEPSILSAIWQGCTTFVTGAAKYNSNLWTMKIEFYGSMFCFMMSALVLSVKSDLAKRLSILIILIFAAKVLRDYLPFIAGVALSYFYASYKLRINGFIAFSLIPIGLYLLGYVDSVNDYAWLFKKEGMQVFFHTLGSLAIIVGLLSSPALAAPMKAKFLVFLGRASFPLYAVHTLVILFPASTIFVFLADYSYIQLPLTFIAVLTISFFLSWPLIYLDEWWTRILNMKTRGL